MVVSNDTLNQSISLGKPTNIAKYDEILTSSKAQAGQVLMLAGSATMKDGMGGASFASKKLSDEKKEDKLSIQIANPFMKKKRSL